MYDVEGIEISSLSLNKQEPPLQVIEIPGEKAEQNMLSKISSFFFENKFLQTVRYGEKEAVKMILENNRLGYKNVNKQYDTGCYEFRDTKVEIIGVDDSDIDYETWFNAIRETAKRGDFEMFMILLDCNMFDVEKSTICTNAIFCDILLKKPSILEDLLESAKFCVNGTDIDSNAVLHFVCSECACNADDSTFCSGDHRNEEIHETTDVLLKFNADVNAKNSGGETALMIASASGCTSIVYTILKWAKETNGFIDINARDIHHQTALMKAAAGKHPGVVRLLVDAGASVNLSDYFGLTALHLAMVEIPSHLEYVMLGNCYGDFEEFYVRKNTYAILSIKFEHPHRIYGRDRKRLNRDRDETLKQLLDCTDIDMNAVSRRGLSPLDIAIIDEDLSLVKLLELNGAKLCAYRNINRMTESNDFSIRGRNMLHRLAVYLQNKHALDEEGYFLVDPPKDDAKSSNMLSSVSRIFGKLSKHIQTHLISAKDFRGRTALHLAVMGGYRPQEGDQSADVVATLISFGCRVNETDNYQRAPLHYAQRQEIADLLIENGADPEKQDQNGIAALEMFKKRVTKCESVWSFLDENMVHQLRPRNRSKKPICLLGPIQSVRFHGVAPARPIYDEERFTKLHDLRKSIANEIGEEIKIFMEELAIEMERKDPKFEIQIMPVGSAYEGTKVKSPDEFDFLFVLTKFSELCEVCQSPDLPTGYIQLKRKLNPIGARNEREFSAYFDCETGRFDAAKLHGDFEIVLSDALRNIDFVKRQHAFDWEYDLSVRTTKAYKVGSFSIPTLYLRKVSPMGGDGVLLENISVDIVPSLRLKPWCLHELLPDFRNKIEAAGCYVVIDHPQSLDSIFGVLR